MFHRCWLILTAGLMLQAETQLRELAYVRPVMWPNEIVPLYDKGFLLYPLRPNRVEILRPGGQPASSFEVPCPGSSTCSVTTLAANSSGSIAVSLAYITASGRTAGIRLIDTSGRELGFIRTGNYLPTALCFDADDNLWSVGRENEPFTDFESREYLLVRKFTPDGKELGRYLPKSLWPARKAQPSRIGTGYWSMRAASDRIGVFVHEGHRDNPAEWVEWDLAGNLLTRTLIKMGKAGRAFTSSGRLYVRFRVPGSKRLELRVLDKKTGAWTAVPDNLPDTPEFDRAFLLGADGDDLVYSLDFRVVLVRPGDIAQ